VHAVSDQLRQQGVIVNTAYAAISTTVMTVASTSAF